jgi:AraC family transcriptional regulator
MNPVEKALWYIESHFAEEIGLEDVAQAAGVSRFHLLRAFSSVTGWPVMRYIRARRLCEAAKRLARCDGGGILDVALEAGYGSHEAFTRAFRQQFGIVPDALRNGCGLETLNLVEPLKMDETPLDTLAVPRFEDGRTLLIAGLRERYDHDGTAAIPSQWQRFQPYTGHVANQTGNAAYGICYNTDDEGNMDYLCGVEVTSFDGLPPELERIRVPPQHYAVFRHDQHISAIRRTFMTIFGKWFPASPWEVQDAPVFERYGERFDPETGSGGFEIWIPVRRKG